MEGQVPTTYTVDNLERALDRVIAGQGDLQIPGTWRLWGFIQEEAANSKDNALAEEVDG